MNCPECKKALPYDFIRGMLRHNLVLATDGSYIAIDAKCPHEECKADMEFFFPLKEINQEPV